MKIKAKLTLGIGLLFGLIVLLTLLSGIFIHKISGDTKNILVANYNTLDYSRNMLIALNNGISDTAESKMFEVNLIKQQQNITEVGERELTDKLVSDFNVLKQKPSDALLIKIIRADISDIMLLNMQAIQRKSNVAESTADKSIFWVSVVGTICFLIAFTLLINLPNNISDPIRELTQSIKEIASENYSKRVNFESHNEFGDLASAFNTMAKKLEEYKAGNLEKMMFEKKRIETLINNMLDPVIGLDEQKHVLFMNNAALAISGLKAEDVLGKLVQDVSIHNDLLRTLIKDLFYDTDTIANLNEEPIKIYANEKESYFEKVIIPIKITPTGERDEIMIGNVILLRNVTPYKELDFAKTNFIATVSHELKTPISSIKMSLQLLENTQVGDLNTEQSDLLHSIKDDANRLLKITGELLNLTQVESGNIQLNIRPCNPKEILLYSIDTIKTQAEQKSISIDIDCSESMPRVLADSEKTAWVLTNLISNAIRYSQSHTSILLSVTNDASNVNFIVRDSGKGIPSQYKDKIFERYFRVPGGGTDGTGLGLAISKEFIEAQGGDIGLESEYGVGSTFTVSLKSIV